jgi:hypothetical protein
VNALHRKGYFTADPEVYGRGVLSLHKEFIARLQGRPAPALWIPTVEVIRDLVTPQKWNADEVLALEQALDIGRDATRKAARQQMRIDPNDEASTDDDEVTEPDLPGNIS